VLDVTALVLEAIQSHQGLAEKYKVTFRADMPEAAPLFGERRRVPPDAGSVQHDFQRGEVFVRWRTRWSSGATVDRPVRMFVRDHGAGIPPGARRKRCSAGSRSSIPPISVARAEPGSA
jgi:hypothetical protein